MDLFIKAYWAVGIVSIAVYLVVFYIEIAPLLQKHKAAGALTWLTNIKDDRNFEKYKELCIKDNKSLFWYNLLSKMDRYTILYLIGWLATLFFAELL